MKKYIVTSPFSVLERILVTEGDEIYAEPVRMMIHVYSSKTKRYLGRVSDDTFKKSVREIALATV